VIVCPLQVQNDSMHRYVSGVMKESIEYLIMVEERMVEEREEEERMVEEREE